MCATSSIFFEISLPNAASWFYFSGLLAVALFFKFSRLLSVRNSDVLTLFLLVPGLLLLLEPDMDYWGYLWLLGASGFYLVRCLVDLALVRRPALSPNLNLGGLAWLAGALFVSLVAVATRPPNSSERTQTGENSQTLTDAVRRGGQELIRQRGGLDVDDSHLRLWVERGLTLLCHLSILVGMVLIGWRHFEDLHAGMACATFYLLLPYTFLLLPGDALGVGRWDHAWPMALMVWAVLAYRHPLLAGFFLGLATGSVFFPVLTLPVWLSFYWRRGALRFALAFGLSAGLCLAILGGLLWINGELPPSLQSAWTQSHWPPWLQTQPDTKGLWRDIPSHRAYRLPVFLTHMAFVVTTFFWPSPKNLAHVLALSAAVLIGIQFWYPDQGGVYVLWYLPFLLLLVFRPNLSACQPPPLTEDWLSRLSRRLVRLLRRLLHIPEAVARVG
jgi:hypothetical protein